jgi:regulator of cell morphogenesis and NO signaling
MSAMNQETVRDLALRVRGATRIFETVGIDYCCGGGRSLEEACRIAGVSSEDLGATLRKLEVADGSAADEKDFGAMSLEALAVHIVETHHAFTTSELTRLVALLAKVRHKHEGNHPELADVGRAFNALFADLMPHMQKEERVLFPYILTLERAREAGRPVPQPPFLTVRNPIRMMMLEHDAAGDYLREIRAATANFEVPEGACMSFRALYEGLEGLERDLHRHIHLENNVLFPRAAEMEAETA